MSLDLQQERSRAIWRGSALLSWVQVPRNTPDSADKTYASVRFTPHYYDSANVYGKTDLKVRFYFPPGVTPQETRYHERKYDEADRVGDRIVFIYRRPDAVGSEPYPHGISFPRSAVDVVHRAPVKLEWLRWLYDRRGPVLIAAIAIAVVGWCVFRRTRRRIKYLPPTLAIEGVGIKGGLTAVEAAILLERPLDKVLTMVVFGLLKKRALRVLSDDPLRLSAIQPRPEAELRSYEMSFLTSIRDDSSLDEDRLRRMLVQLVKAVNAKIRGYCRGETVAHYRSIVSRAWEQVEAASTPAIKSRPFDEDLEWMMMDDGFERRARRILAKGPVLMPAWWDDYRPWAPVVHDARSATSTPTQGRGRSPAARGARGEGGQIALPTLPGAAFASTLVGGIERSAGGVVDRPESLTAEVGDRTGRLVGLRRGRVERLPDRPRPRTRPASKGSRSEAPSFPSSSDAGSSSCACACACAGCACACAGGGR